MLDAALSLNDSMRYEFCLVLYASFWLLSTNLMILLYSYCGLFTGCCAMMAYQFHSKRSNEAE